MALPELALLQPAWLLLWPVAPLLAWLLGRRLGWMGIAGLFGSRLRWRHPALARLQGSSTRAARHLLPLAAWTCLLLALAQPVRLAGPLPGPKAPLDLVVLLDTSISMVLTDYRRDQQTVSRLDFAKGLVDRLAADYRGERLGLYLLGSPSARLLPLTRDPQLFRHTLARVTPTLAGRRAELGDALALIAADLEALPAGRERAVLLVTDGTQPSGALAPEDGAERLRRAGASLHILVTGARGDVEPDSRSGLLFAPARPGQLERLAEGTGGGSYPAEDVGALGQAMTALAEQHLEQTDRTPRRQEPLYQWLLLVALLLMLARPPSRRAAP